MYLKYQNRYTMR